jgi:response regulator NasT
LSTSSTVQIGARAERRARRHYRLRGYRILAANLRSGGVEVDLVCRTAEQAETLAAERTVPVLLLTAYSDREFVDRAVDAGVMGYLVKPFAEAQLKPAIEVALERWREVRQIQQDLAETKETLETRKLVERAKGVLMDSQNLKEAEAFRRIQRLSMNSRKSMREVAEAILLAHEAGRSL